MDHLQLIDQASEFILDPAGIFVLKRWNGDPANDKKPFWVICDTWSHTMFLDMEGNWDYKKKEQSWLDSILWCDPLAAASFYYGWRSKFYWVYVKGDADRNWNYQIYTRDLGKAEVLYSELQTKRPTLHWLLVGTDRKIIKEDIGFKKQNWIEYPLRIDPSVYLDK